jgi:uncharacterized protein YukE
MLWGSRRFCHIYAVTTDAPASLAEPVANDGGAVSIVGADLAQLNQLVTKLGGPDTQAVAQSLAEMNAAVQDSSSYWIGDHADGFRAGFTKFAASVTDDLRQMLERAAQTTGQNLNAIARATGAAGGSPAVAVSEGTPNGRGAANTSAGAVNTSATGSATLGGVSATLFTEVSDTSFEQSQVNAAVAYFDQYINATVPRFGPGRFDYQDVPVGAQEVLQDWQALSPANLDAALQALTPQELQELNDAMPDASQAVQQGWAQMILSRADSVTIAQLELSLPNMPLEPPLPSGSKLTYQPLPGSSTLFGGGIDPDAQINQGDLGDCYFMAALAAVAAADPTFIQNHIAQNANGTYTITLYQNGQPVPVTILPDLPATADGANVYDLLPQDGATWAALYEKAYAQLNGGYDAIGTGGDTVHSLPAITGKSPSTFYWNQPGINFLHDITFGLEGNPPSLANIQALLASGQPVTAGTTGNDVWPPDAPVTYKRVAIGPRSWKEVPVYSGPMEIVGDHYYRVDNVSTDAQTGQLVITLVNPWGQDDTAQGMPSVTLTAQQFAAYFNEIAW